MVNASTSYISTSTLPQLWPSRERSFLVMMVILAVVDAFLLLWILNPLARPDKNVRLTAITYDMDDAANAGAKPSPFGPMASNRLRAHK